MMNVRGRAAGLLAALCLVAAGGCGGPASVDSSESEATVKGVVKIDGVPATEGEISFDPTNYQREDAKIRTAPIGKDGTYTIVTLTGENIVRIGGSLVKKKEVLNNVKRATIVKSGENTFDFVLGDASTAPVPAKGKTK